MWARRSAQTEERHANVKPAFSERLRGHRDAEKEGARAVPSELGRKTCLSLNKFQLLRKRGLRPIFQSRSTVLFRTRNWNQGFMHVRQVSSTEVSGFYLLIIIWCLKKLILLLYKVTYKLSSKAHGQVKKKPEQTKKTPKLNFCKTNKLHIHLI